MSAAIDEIDAAEAQDAITANEANAYRADCVAQLAEFHREIRHYAGQLIDQGRQLVWTEESST